MNNIFFDFDGTLINSQHRLYNLFIELCPECNMTYDEYWKIKRRRITQKDFLKKYFNFSDQECDSFHRTWLKEVEKPSRFKQDFLYDGIKGLLEKLSKKYNLYIVTNRQSGKMAQKEAQELGIREYFKDILVTEQKKTKVELIKENTCYSAQDTLVGDTGEDIKTAHSLNITPIAVGWGIIDEDVLEEYKPHKIVRKVEELESYFI